MPHRSDGRKHFLLVCRKTIAAKINCNLSPDKLPDKFPSRCWGQNFSRSFCDFSAHGSGFQTPLLSRRYKNSSYCQCSVIPGKQNTVPVHCAGRHHPCMGISHRRNCPEISESISIRTRHKYAVMLTAHLFCLSVSLMNTAPSTYFYFSNFRCRGSDKGYTETQMQMTYRSVPASKFFFGVHGYFSRLYGVALVCDLLHQFC